MDDAVSYSYPCNTCPKPITANRLYKESGLWNTFYICMYRIPYIYKIIPFFRMMIFFSISEQAIPLLTEKKK
jgi:hypothetical protein